MYASIMRFILQPFQIDRVERSHLHWQLLLSNLDIGERLFYIRNLDIRLWRSCNRNSKGKIWCQKLSFSKNI